MVKFIKGLELCEKFFFEIAKPIIDVEYPKLKYSAGLIGYGSDVLGYDDEVSRDHMWGPRFYLFLREEDLKLKEAIFEIFRNKFPYEYQGYSVNFTEPDPSDNGVQHSKMISAGKVNPLVFIHTFNEFLKGELGRSDIENLNELDWLTISEHRLLSLVSGEFFVDDLNLMVQLQHIKYYPNAVRNYLIASNWDIIASEQAFIKRCSDVGDELGSIIICSRIAERLMRLCFLYQKVYAPYSKWFGKAFTMLDVGAYIKDTLVSALQTTDNNIREEKIILAQALVAELHNNSGITAKIDYAIESYYGRTIKVIFADKFSSATADTLQGTALENIPLIGTFSEIGGLSSFSDDKKYYNQIKRIYK
ncbi:MAG: DUF4037 domain-containing protein [Mobilitalea sp.]